MIDADVVRSRLDSAWSNVPCEFLEAFLVLLAGVSVATVLYV